MGHDLKELAEIKGVKAVRAIRIAAAFELSRRVIRELEERRVKKDELKNAKVPASELPAMIHLNRQIPPEPHTAMYVWHKYWSRKTWNVVGKFIETYSREQEMIFDPFAGSGVTAIEAVRNKRRVIACDLNPVASHITELTLRPVNLIKLLEAFERVRGRCKRRLKSFTKSTATNAANRSWRIALFGKETSWWKSAIPAARIAEHRCETGCPILTLDEEILVFQEKKRIKEWYPRHRLFYADGSPFKEKQQYDSLDQLFTRRNLASCRVAARSDSRGEKSRSYESFSWARLPP